jgi:hypothetical protein
MNRFMLWPTVIVLASALCGCATRSSQHSGSASGSTITKEASTATSAASPIDGPEVSRSTGIEGGVIVFWPRILPDPTSEDTRATAAALQARLRAIVAEALPGHPIDVRPEPERVCPQTGCSAMTVGALLVQKGTGCAALALVAGPGMSSTTIVPWVGAVQVHDSDVPFREYPENHVSFDDLVSCSTLLDQLEEHKPEIVAAIQARAH